MALPSPVQEAHKRRPLPPNNASFAKSLGVGVNKEMPEQEPPRQRGTINWTHIAITVALLAMSTRIYQLRFQSRGSILANGVDSDLLRTGRFQDVISGKGARRDNLTLTEHNAVGIAHYMLGNPSTSMTHFKLSLIHI